MNEALERALREKGIVTPEDRIRFALKVGVSDNTIRRWLAGKHTPHPELGKRAARRLGVSYEELWPE